MRILCGIFPQLQDKNDDDECEADDDDNDNDDIDGNPCYFGQS